MQFNQLTKREILMVLKMRDEASGPMDDFGKSTEDTSDRVKDFEGTVKEASGTLKDFAAGLIGAFSTGELFTRALGSFRQYETGILGVAKTTGMAGQELAQFSSQFDQMSASMAVPQQDLLAIAQAAGQLGIQGSQNILAFTETIAKLQTASDLTADDAAMALARISNVTGEGIEGVENYANVVVALGNKVAATEREITAVALELAKTTAIYDLGTNSVAAYAAAFAQIGTQPDIAASSTARVLRELDNAANESGAALTDVAEIIGVTEQEFTKLVKTDPSQALYRFLEGLQPVLSDTGRLNNVFKGLNLQGEEINKTILPLVKNFGLLEDALDISETASASATALQQEYELFASSMDSLFTRISNSADIMFKNLGVGLEPVLRPMFEGIADLIDFVAGALENMPAPLRSITSAALIATPALAGMGATFRLITGTLPTMTAMLGVATGAIRALLGPLGLISLAVTGVVMAFGSAESAATKLANLQQAGSEAVTALTDYAEVSARVTGGQEDMKGKIDEATEALLSQRRASLLIARDKLREELSDVQASQTEDGWIFNSNLARFTDIFNAPGLRDTDLSRELNTIRTEIEAGEISLGSLNERFNELAGVSGEAGEAAKSVLVALNGNGSESLDEIGRDLRRLAQSAGMFEEQLRAVEEASTPDEKVAAYRALALEVGAVALAGANLRDEGAHKALYDASEAAAQLEPQLVEINGVLDGTLEASEALDKSDPLKPLIENANEAVSALALLRSSMEELPKDIQVNLRGLENSTDAMGAARSIITSKEGYRSNAYWDMNAYRAGYGSDTTTKLGTDGTPMVVKITKDSIVTEQDSLRDLDRRIRDEFMPAAARALGEVWDTLTPAQQGYMTSLTYNYGAGAWDNPSKLGPVKLASQVSREAMADAVARLGDHNGGMNRDRRLEEAASLRFGTGSGGVLKNYEDELSDQNRAAEEAAQKAKDVAEAQKEFLDSISGTSEGLRLEQQLIGRSASDRAYLTEKTRLLTEAQKEGIALDEYRADLGMTTRQAIEQEAQAVQKLTLENEKLQAVQDRAKANGNGFMADFGKGMDEFVATLDSSVELAAGTVETLSGASSDFLSNMLDENMGFFDALRATASSVLADIGRMLLDHAMKVLIFKNLLNLGGTTPASPSLNAMGNSFDSAGVMKFANGGDFTNGVYSQPTMFRFGMNKLGVMGEAGPEAVMPLEKSGKGGYGVIFETIDPMTKKRIRRVVPLGRDGTGKLIASDAQLFAKGESFSGNLSGLLGGDSTSGGGRAPLIGSLSVNTGFNVNGGAGGSKTDEATAQKASKILDNEIRATVARTVTDMMAPGGLLYGRS